MVVGRAAPAGAGRAGAGRAGHRAQRVAQVAVLVALQQRLEQVQRRRRRRALPDKDENKMALRCLDPICESLPALPIGQGPFLQNVLFLQNVAVIGRLSIGRRFLQVECPKSKISSYRLPVFFFTFEIDFLGK